MKSVICLFARAGTGLNFAQHSSGRHTESLHSCLQAGTASVFTQHSSNLLLSACKTIHKLCMMVFCISACLVAPRNMQCDMAFMSAGSHSFAFQSAQRRNTAEWGRGHCCECLVAHGCAGCQPQPASNTAAATHTIVHLVKFHLVLTKHTM